ncbi:MAG TPA: right-handed parallel beta-helix repeat-containing protein, partial [Bacteroidales bacterium]|nr:right-handed parallel beta-helix repeat-containing protein [Bacteroidales bacterium]
MKSALILVFVILHTVASATDYYVSSAGNDANDGLSPSTSWKTIAKVNSSFINLSPGDRILFNRGDIFYGTIIIGKSGSSGNPITLSAYGTGADPVISGFTTLSSWTNEGSNIYSKAVALASKSYLIVKVNGVNTAAGRYPNAGSWLSIDATSGSTQLTDAAIDASVTNWTGAEAVIRTDEFRMERVLISNHTSHTLTYAPTSEGALTGYGYFIQSDLRTLDQANEWFYDGTKFYIYGDPTAKKVEVSAYTNGVSINSFDYITFDHLSITGYGKNGFDIVDGSYISIKNCTIKFCGETGVYGYDETNGNSTGCIISDNVINQINGSGIYISSQFSNSYISGNTIKNIGMIVGAAHATGWELTMQGIILGNSSY